MASGKKLLLYYLLFILTYTALQMTTGMILMGYEDSWDESEGKIWTLESMSLLKQIAYILWYVPNFPFGLIIKNGIPSLIAICIVDPLVMGWLLLRISRHRHETTKRYTIGINAFILIAIILGWTYFLTS